MSAIRLLPVTSRFNAVGRASGCLTGLPLVAWLLVVATFALFPAGPVTAQPEEARGRAQVEARRLAGLKEKHSERFARVMEERLAELRKRLAQAETRYPETYARVVNQIRRRRDRRLEALRTYDPDQFSKRVQRRLTNIDARLRRLKVVSPERYAALMARRRQWRASALEPLRQSDMDRYARFLQDYPDWREALEPERRRVPNPAEGTREQPAPSDSAPSVRADSPTAKANEEWLDQTVQLFEILDQELPDDLSDGTSDEELLKELSDLDTLALPHP